MLFPFTLHRRIDNIRKYVQAYIKQSFEKGVKKFDIKLRFIISISILSLIVWTKYGCFGLALLKVQLDKEKSPHTNY